MTSVVIVSLLLVCGGVGWALGTWKGKPLLGVFAGVMLGPLGWMLMLTYPSQRSDRIEAESRTSSDH